MSTQLIGRYIVTDPQICHGKPPFRGTRIMVWQVLEQIPSGIAWETIVDEWEGSITKEAIAEAVQFGHATRNNITKQGVIWLQTFWKAW